MGNCQDRELLTLAYSYAFYLSDDPRTKNGAVIFNSKVIGYGVNRIPKGVILTEDRLISPLKYKFIEHAERNAIFSVIQNGQGNLLNGSTMYCPWFACTDCAKAIIQVGIKRVVGHLIRYKETNNWTEEIKIANTMLDEAGVIRGYLDCHMNCVGIWDGEEHLI